MWQKLLYFLFIMGPGLITANVDNDANGIATYSIAGSHFGYKLLWVLILAALLQAVIQEMTTRMGCITRKGLADLIRENFSLKFTFWVMLALFLANYANIIGDFAGLGAALELFHLPFKIFLPIATVGIWALVLVGSYQKIERVFLAACLIYVTYIISAFLAKPDWGAVLKDTVSFPVVWDKSFLLIAVAVVGTTVAPWMQFFQQGIVRDKGLIAKELPYSKWDTYLGCLMMGLVGYFIIAACGATLHPAGIRVETAEDAARALAPLAGNYTKLLFGIGLLNAALFSIPIITLATAYAICEAFGLESGIGLRIKEAPAFFSIFTFLLFSSALILLFIPHKQLFNVMMLSQAINGVLMPLILGVILVLINKSELMGKYKNSLTSNVIGWGSAGILTLASLLLLVLGNK